MPNWSSNISRIKFKDADTKEAVKAHINEHGDFTSFFLPTPEDVFTGNLGQKEEELYPGELNWYGWNTKHLGCKWRESDVEIQSETSEGDDSGFGESLTISYETPWCPPDNALSTIGEDDRVEYVLSSWSEIGMGQMGFSHACSEGFLDEFTNEWSWEDVEDDNGDIDWEATSANIEAAREEYLAGYDAISMKDLPFGG